MVREALGKRVVGDKQLGEAWLEALAACIRPLEQRLERSYGRRIVRVRYEVTLQLSDGAVRAPSVGQGFRK